MGFLDLIRNFMIKVHDGSVRAHYLGFKNESSGVKMDEMS
jgi:hypothetical protein